MAEAYKKINELTEMLAVDINESTKMVVSTGAGGVGKNLNVSDLVVNNLSSSSEHRALSAAMGKKLSEEKAPINSPIFTGIANFEGDVQVSENVIIDGDARSYNSIVDNRLQFGQGAVVKIQTGMSGGTPVYREFPATELASSDLNGTQYVMVYGTGTPEENADELQAAYDAAKNMPRYLGSLSTANPISYNVYKGQTFYDTENEDYYICHTNYTANVGSLNDKSTAIVESQAKSTRTTVIVAPGEYNFATSFDIYVSAVNVISLTGMMDVKINSVFASSSYCTIHGIDCGTNLFDVSGTYQDLTISKCSGGESSFGGSDSASPVVVTATFIDCIGGKYSFGGNCEAAGKFIRCIGGDYSFGGVGGGFSEGAIGIASGYFEHCEGGHHSFGGGDGTASGLFEYCKGHDYCFGKFASGQFNNCIAANSSFGWGTSGDGYFSGIARKCVGGTECFKSGGSSSANAKVHYCEAISSEMVSIPHLYCISAGVVVP